MSARLKDPQDQCLANDPFRTKTVHQTEEAGRPKTLSYSLSYSVGTFWLFTKSDFATFLLPDTAFGVFGALAGPLLSSNETPDLLMILGRLPRVLLYNWGNLFVCDLANQRLPEAVEEDRGNKPWRPLPSGRITMTQARRLLLVSLPIVLAINWVLGAWEETALLFTLAWMYNDLKGGDEDFVTRNLMNALAFAQFNGGALKIACGIDQSITALGYTWVILISCVIFTTMHVQDLKDQTGDKARGRRTAPLVLGDGVARWILAIPIVVWSAICPLFLNVGLPGYLITCVLGFLLVMRIFLWRSIDADRKTYKLWAAWIAVLYMLPVIKNPLVFSKFMESRVR